MSSEDRNLIARAADGDSAAFSLITFRYRSRLERAGKLLLRSPEDAEDVAQETLARALLQLRRYRGAAEPSTWLHSIALNICRHWMRTGRRQVYTSDPALLERDCRRPWSTTGVLPRVLRRETDRILRLALECLTDAQRDAFVLHYLEGMPHESVARSLKTTIQGARALCHRARTALRARLRRHLVATG